MLLSLWSACEDPSLSVDDPLNECAKIRCGEQVCAYLEGQPTCICPPPTYEDEEGRCADPPSPLAPDQSGFEQPFRDESVENAQLDAALPPEADTEMTGLDASDVEADAELIELDAEINPPDIEIIELDAELTQPDAEVTQPDADLSIDLCNPNPCVAPHRGRCEPFGGGVLCRCDEGYVEDPLTRQCILPDPCDPHPCVEMGRGVCQPTDVGFECLCDEGLIEEEPGGICTLPVLGLCEGSHFEGDFFEPNECHEEATRIPLNTAQLHSIQPSGDDDWFRLDATPGHIYQLLVTRGTLPNAILYLYRSDGIHTIFSQSSTYEITYELGDAGPYFYRVSAYNNNQLGDYTVILNDLGLDDHGDEPALATPIIVDGAPMEGSIETRGDDDWFTFEAEVGRLFRITLTRGTISGSYLYLYRPDGLRIAESHSTPEEITFELDEPGRWYIRVRHSGTGSGTYQLSLEDVGVDDHGDEASEGTPVVIDGVVHGEIETWGDLDYFTLSAVRGQVYALTLDPNGLSSSTLRLYDPISTQVSYSSSGSLVFEADQTGEWAILVRHASSASLGNYGLRVDDLGPDDHADGVINATQLAANSLPISGNIETQGDLDYFALNLNGGQVYRVESTGLDVHMTFIDQDGVTELGQTGGDTLDLSIVDPGVYFLKVRSDILIRTGIYTLTLID